jgi:hypothetical protein
MVFIVATVGEVDGFDFALAGCHSRVLLLAKLQAEVTGAAQSSKWPPWHAMFD